jgi:hypothetical protein
MILFLLYFAFLTLFTLIGALIGYLVDGRYPGSGSLVGIGIFMIALWVAWTVSVRITERFWPDQKAA